MNKHETNKINQKWKAIISLIIGFFGIFPLIWWWNTVFVETPMGKMFYVFLNKKVQILSLFFGRNIAEQISLFIMCYLGFCSTYSYLFLSLFLIFGILLGIKSLKSSYRKIAILGIILCTIDLMGSLFTTYVWWWFLAR
jgi:hypothetical protein